eukprot:m.195345 g.195345  ORF g.195345 m.195345 type:complete len:539 (+) comp19460_c0_seq1:468-2084(+)
MWAATVAPAMALGVGTRTHTHMVYITVIGTAISILLLLVCMNRRKKERQPSTIVNTQSQHSTITVDNPARHPAVSGTGGSTHAQQPIAVTSVQRRETRRQQNVAPMQGMSGTDETVASSGPGVAMERNNSDTVVEDDPRTGPAAGAPAWYAGKLSRDICEETVLAASRGDFLVRESTRGDRCVVCINIGGKVMNLMVIARDGKYRFAGKYRNSLEDVIFFLRLKPLLLKGGPCRIAKPAQGLQDALIRDRARQGNALGMDSSLHAAQQSAENARRLEFSQSNPDQAAPQRDSDSHGGHTITADDLYGNARELMDEFDNGDEPLYVDMYDANVPSSEWIAREEERHRLEKAGVQRLSNEAFGQLRLQARQRAESAARENKRLSQLAVQKSDVRKAWQKSTIIKKGASMQLPADDTHENFFGYQNASLREFGGYEEDEIYDSVPRWFAGKLNRDTCDAAVIKSGNGSYLIRESSSGDRYIVCINHSGTAKNFQIMITDQGRYKFSGNTYANLQELVTFLKRNGITKNGQTIPLSSVAQWS